ncbi:MAG: hypothetical protein KGJ41_06520 [Rhodospirillales bacterium]|nr:hypothetical protein [Rhodospirillales bacterium]MDE2198657.1 hypothetical protein [Rhodospirillales bacterium]MDE2573851.1 hypothetical protein [Rhodospirillales bacterium]
MSQNTTDETLDDAARRTLRANDRGGYTVPTSRLYPFQWNWDSAFVAMGFATFDELRAWREIASLLRGQWEDGMIPQIVFHAASDDYFPGPDVWGIARTPPTSGITQPPVLASAARRLLDRAADTGSAEDRMAAIYPCLLRNHRWWQQARDPARTGLVSTLHPWETGMDNSPAWDAALARVPSQTTTPIRRRDTSHVDAAMRPHESEYRRFIHLVDLFRAEGWNAARMLAVSPFRVADIGTNAILLRAERDLLALAARFGTPADAAEITARIAAMQPAIAAQWNAAHGLFLSRDLRDGAPINAATSAGLLPLWAQAATPAQAAAMGATLDRWAARVPFLVPSCDPADPRFEPRRYWRGPIWAVVNWMIAEGLAAGGDAARAGRIRADTARLIREGGLSEYFNPTDGGGIGGRDFSWTAAIHLLLQAG